MASAATAAQRATVTRRITNVLAVQAILAILVRVSFLLKGASVLISLGRLRLGTLAGSQCLVEGGLCVMADHPVGILLKLFSLKLPLNQQKGLSHHSKTLQFGQKLITF